VEHFPGREEAGADFNIGGIRKRRTAFRMESRSEYNTSFLDGCFFFERPGNSR
jgi:hypothetical protein